MNQIADTPAETIRQQIGHRAFYMLGASNLMYSAADPNWLSFRIKGSRTINYIKVTLDAMDTYTMEFGKISNTTITIGSTKLKGAPAYKVVKTLEGIYFDQLHDLITENTGLYTSL